MLTTYSLQAGRLTRVEAGGRLPDTAVWIDLFNPTREEESAVEQLMGIEVPTQEEMAEIEESSRLYSDNGALYMTAILLERSEELPRACPVTFILAHGRLVTLRYAEPSVFRTFPKQAEKGEGNFKGADGVFIALIEAIIDRGADILENIAADVDKRSREIFEHEAAGGSLSRDFKDIMQSIGRSGDLNSKIRKCLVSLGRLVNFLSAECGDLHPELRERTQTMQVDVRSLTDHASYIAGVIDFLVNATVGLISIQQNDVIKILSIVSVVIMPPMLIASIYGMNFHIMPELSWRFGYPLALLAMLAAMIVPYWYFKRRGWL
jgi:magnesium transporter